MRDQLSIEGGARFKRRADRIGHDQRQIMVGRQVFRRARGELRLDDHAGQHTALGEPANLNHALDAWRLAGFDDDGFCCQAVMGREIAEGVVIGDRGPAAEIYECLTGRKVQRFKLVGQRIGVLGDGAGVFREERDKVRNNGFGHLDGQLRIEPDMWIAARMIMMRFVVASRFMIVPILVLVIVFVLVIIRYRLDTQRLGEGEVFARRILDSLPKTGLKGRSDTEDQIRVLQHTPL